MISQNSDKNKKIKRTDLFEKQMGIVQEEQQ